MNNKIKELFMRIPYGVKVMAPGWDDDVNEEITIISEVYELCTDGYLRLKEDETGDQYYIDDVKLCLRPLSALTEKEKRELLNRLFTDEHMNKFTVLDKGVVQEIEHESSTKNFEVLYPTFDPKQCSIYVDFLYDHQIDFSGLIESGDAVDISKI